MKRVMYDVDRISGVHATSGIPGANHHVPGMHKIIRQMIPDDYLRKTECWDRRTKSRGINNRKIDIL